MCVCVCGMATTAPNIARAILMRVSCWFCGVCNNFILGGVRRTKQFHDLSLILQGVSLVVNLTLCVR